MSGHPNRSVERVSTTHWVGYVHGVTLGVLLVMKSNAISDGLRPKNIRIQARSADPGDVCGIEVHQGRRARERPIRRGETHTKRLAV